MACGGGGSGIINQVWGLGFEVIGKVVGDLKPHTSNLKPDKRCFYSKWMTRSQHGNKLVTVAGCSFAVIG